MLSGNVQKCSEYERLLILHFKVVNKIPTFKSLSRSICIGSCFSVFADLTLIHSDSMDMVSVLSQAFIVVASKINER